MKFPLLNISVKKWDIDELTDYIIFDEFIYTNKESAFTKLYKNKLFIDCDGRIYTVTRKAKLTKKWRNWLVFIPNICKRQILFKPTGERWMVDDLRNFLLDRISELKTDEQTEKWKTELIKATNHFELIYGKVKNKHNTKP